MPVTPFPGHKRTSGNFGGKTMAREAEKARRWRRWALAGWALAAALIVLPTAALFVMAATDDEENIVLARNEVVAAPGGMRAWRGTFWNHSDSLYTKLDTVILFVDAQGKPVGQARGGSPRLDPGEAFHIEAPLPERAARMQVYQLRWTGPGGGSVALGPYRAWPFGYVQNSACSALRLKIGSCTPMREIR